MIVEGWLELNRAIERSIPCYRPISVSSGPEVDCGQCEGCKDYEAVMGRLGAVEGAIEEALKEAETRVLEPGPRVYALEVTYPDGSDKSGWEPQNWDPELSPDLYGERYFKWPKNRRYLSASSAHRRAQLFRSYGCEVDVVASEPIQWPSALQRTERDMNRKSRAIQSLVRILEDTA